MNLISDIHHFREERFTAERMCKNPSENIKNLTKTREGDQTPLILLTANLVKCDGSNIVLLTGCANLATACGIQDGTNFAIVGLTGCSTGSATPTDNQLQFTAQTYAHELGHMLGMKHDFDDKHGGERGPCDKKGFMSYGYDGNEWSECSRKDFSEWFKNFGYTCLDYGDTDCGGYKATSCSSCDRGCGGNCAWRRNGCAPKTDGFIVQPNYGWRDAEGDIQNLKITEHAQSMTDCEEDCLKTAGCVGYTYVSSIKQCDLKTNAHAVKLQFEGDGIFLGGLQLRQGAGWHDEERSVDTLKVVSATKAAGCEVPCNETEGCVGWTYVIAEQRCDLKTKSQAVSYSFIYEDVVSGLIQ